MSVNKPPSNSKKKMTNRNPNSRKKKKKSINNWFSIFKKNKKIVKKKSKKKSIRIMGFLGKSCLFMFSWGLLFGGVFILWFSYDLPSLNSLTESNRKPSITFQSMEGHVVGSFGDSYEDSLGIDELPKHVWQAFIAVEDRRFFSHFGLDLVGLFRAFYANYTAGRIVQGGSTITQQVAKNFLQSKKIYDYRDRSLRRKVQEALMSLWLEAKFTKKQIIAMYINRTYFGSGAYGVDAASHAFFGKSARDIKAEEAAIIAGLLKAPSKYSPRANPNAAKKRGLNVISKMHDAGFVDSVPKNLDHIKFASSEHRNGAQYFCEWIMDTLPDYVGAIDKDLIVVTTLHSNVQEEAEKACKSVMKEHGKKFKATQCALVAMSPDGAVKAMVGGLNYYKNQYNRAASANRQSGSLFKIFVYLAALEAGYNENMLISDSKFKIGDWEPSLYYWKPKGEVPLKLGFIKSINTVTVRVAQMVGAKKIALIAKRLGITTDMTYDLSMALGSKEMNLVDMTSSITTFINNYRSVWPYGIVEIRDKSNGKILYQHKKTLTPKVLSNSVGGAMKQMLRDVIYMGTGYNARVKNIDCYGKTGSNGDLDAWFAGFREGKNDNERMSAVVWVGNDNNAPMYKRSTGSRIPSWIWNKFIKNTDKILKNIENYDYKEIIQVEDGEKYSLDENIESDRDSELDKIIESTSLQ